MGDEEWGEGLAAGEAQDAEGAVGPNAGLLRPERVLAKIIVQLCLIDVISCTLIFVCVIGCLRDSIRRYIEISKAKFRAVLQSRPARGLDSVGGGLASRGG